MADVPGSWLTKVQPFQAALIAGFLVVGVVLGIWGGGTYNFFGVLAVDNRTEQFEDFFARKLESAPPETRRQYLERAVIAALNVADSQPAADFDRARFIIALEPHLSRFGAYRLQGGLVRDRLESSDPTLTLGERQQLAASAARGMARLVTDKQGFAPSGSLAVAMADLGFLHERSAELLDHLRRLDPQDPMAVGVRQMLYDFEGPFHEPQVFLEASGSFIAAVHGLTTADRNYYRHEVVTTLWHDAFDDKGIFRFERPGVEVRVDRTLEPGEAMVCRGERELYGAGFFLFRDRAFAHVRAKESAGSRDCSLEALSEAATLTVWLAPIDAARLLEGAPAPLPADAYPIEGVLLRRSLAHDFLPPASAPLPAESTRLRELAAELAALP